MKELKKQKGFSLYLAILILAPLLAISLALTSFLVIQIKMIRGMEESVLAFYAADTGIERMLSRPVSDLSEDLPNGSSYVAQIRCSYSHETCPYIYDPSCDAPKYCLKSIGKFRKTKRAIEVKY